MYIDMYHFHTKSLVKIYVVTRTWYVSSFFVVLAKLQEDDMFIYITTDLYIMRIKYKKLGLER